MENVPVLSVYSHQEVEALPSVLLGDLEDAGRRAVPQVLRLATHTNTPLAGLEEIEVSLVDDRSIADVHLRFMDIAGATDVITFDHGEILISVETARRQAREFGHDFQSELMLYIIHGLLHLAGHEDASEKGRATMNELQESVLKQVWSSV